MVIEVHAAETYDAVPCSVPVAVLKYEDEIWLPVLTLAKRVLVVDVY